ncbi:CLUMA_CG012119, isoform A [Clunio marinus]|uniref:SUMO-activating enzyme subunit 1 n=1 Tax=Clunio marinus TaxID=568069 RepID=A0A1J1IH20_9DIPT|nr:CLUMA_CG012119, isoform A [Clunio marinus]
MVEHDHSELTPAEAELYDRQIRLWGLENQKRLRNSKILIAGLNGLGAEIAKNIILGGVKSVTFLDHQIVTENDFASNFLVPRDCLNKNRAESSFSRAQALNPMVEVKIDTGLLSDKGEDFFKLFDVVVILESTIAEQIRINNICRANNIKFYATDMWGMFGFSFIDLQDHEFVEDVVKHKIISKPNEKIKTEIITTPSKRSLKYPSLESVINFDYNSPSFTKRMKKSGPAYLVMKILQNFREDEKRDPMPSSREEDINKLLAIRNGISSVEIVPDIYFEHVFAQISPSAAIVGGAVAHEVIKAVSQKEAPHFNYFFFDANNSCGFIETIE